MSSKNFVISNNNNSLPILLVPYLHHGEGKVNYHLNPICKIDETFKNMGRLKALNNSNNKENMNLITFPNRLPTPPHSPERFCGENMNCDNITLSRCLANLDSKASTQIRLPEVQFPKSSFCEKTYAYNSTPRNYQWKTARKEIFNRNSDNNVSRLVESVQDYQLRSNRLSKSTTTKVHKRQRRGRSCDNCRMNKTRCDARFEVLLQNKYVMRSISKKLHYILKKRDIIKYSKHGMILEHIKIPEDLLKDNDHGVKLIKSLDKIILFHPCSSCHRTYTYNKKNVDKTHGRECIYSTGYIKSDMHIYNVMIHNISKELPLSGGNGLSKKLYDLTISDYKKYFVNGET
ncbi:hypothetical protein TPHA_0H00560 [Tetrapisispora phaffii CBS 4417]|uniref:Zn(2)-C6 fungal-type domain-containing protein n=1 Tax=Tetrapisispora phaffii (strain ATCC 24235 / CBS 4417 / NBRC 1672 / NRRL Y-8282 / UCD 70-5) TaxID=1071381 RepID=G8BWW2_TETPH|nr:hypothetical protein TPHA_0H00560 [Tetrapisispora phaffii CBS 4417]CCE64266.1 hypothetical protein TPHA_0H00560 [Tetrapisispora phaffii CBS 4417]